MTVTEEQRREIQTRMVMASLGEVAPMIAIDSREGRSYLVFIGEHPVTYAYFCALLGALITGQESMLAKSASNETVQLWLDLGLPIIKRDDLIRRLDKLIGFQSSNNVEVTDFVFEVERQYAELVAK